MLEILKDKIEKAKIVSFDIFDTLLLRPYAKPVDLFLHLEKLYGKKGFMKARIKAENEARQISSNEEIKFDEIYEKISNEFKDLKQKELDLEAKTLVQNPQMKEIFDFCKKQNKITIITSDMYLSKDFLTQILNKNGFKNFDNFYLSSDILKTKHSGNLYKQILQDFKVKNEEILHIGDNYHADILMAQKFGLQNFHYQKAIDKLLQENENLQTFYKLYPKNIATSVILGICAIYNLTENKNYLEKFGFFCGGALVYGYCIYLHNELKKDNIKEIMFLARDGFLLKKVFDIIAKDEFKTNYFYAPRILNIIINLECENLEKTKIILEFFKNKNEFLKQNTPNDLKDGKNFIQKHKNLYENLAKNEILNYQKYLKNFDIQNSKLALIDTSSINLSAQKLLSKVLKNSEIFGYYWLVFNNFANTKSFQKDTNKKFLNWNFVEFLLSAPNPPTDFIENGKVVFKKINENERIRIEKFQIFSKEILEFAKITNQIFGKLNLFLDDEILRNFANIIYQNPSLQDIENFGHLRHYYDAKQEKFVYLFPDWIKTSKDIKIFDFVLFEIVKKLNETKILLFGKFDFIKFVKLNEAKQRVKIFGINICKINVK